MRNRFRRGIRLMLVQEGLRQDPRKRLMLSAVEPFDTEHNAGPSPGRLVTICAEQSIPPCERASVVDKHFASFLGMVDPMHVGRDEEKPNDAVQ